jgi:hypothetical protein
MKSIYKIETWTLKELPPGKKPISVKWVYNIKQTLDQKTQHIESKVSDKGL